MSELIEIAAQKIAAASHPVSFSGAGLSAESGIDTFRQSDNATDTEKSALWSSFDPAKLASQEGFSADPGMVIDWYNWRRKTLADAVPNLAHETLGRQRGWVHITQNVDNLLEAGGAYEEDVLHLHGSILTDRCNGECGHKEVVDLHNPKGLRDCPQCGRRMRPSVVWFGESLPTIALNRATVEVEKADLLLVVGTSAQVYPAAGLIPFAIESNTDVIIVNTDRSLKPDENIIEILGKAGDVLPQLFKYCF